MDDAVADEIVGATSRAPCEHGYAQSTMQDIADRTDRITAALHYDGKCDLLLALLDHPYAGFADRVRHPAGDTPAERPRSSVDLALTPPERGGRAADRPESA
ncbi:MAG: hypothetical protein ABEH78_03840 [Haloferacaceae archaeon]